MLVIRRAAEFHAFGVDAPNEFEELTMQTATLAKIVRDPRSGEVHVPNERVAILAVMQNLNRTLLKVRWRAGGDCVIFPEDLNGNSSALAGDGSPGSSQSEPGIVSPDCTDV
jgi:hypothetical protein